MPGGFGLLAVLGRFLLLGRGDASIRGVNRRRIRVDDSGKSRRLSLFDQLAIRWRHRSVTNRQDWRLRIKFDEMVSSNYWDLAQNADELNERYVDYSDQYGSAESDDWPLEERFPPDELSQ